MNAFDFEDCSIFDYILKVLQLVKNKEGIQHRQRNALPVGREDQNETKRSTSNGGEKREKRLGNSLQMDSLDIDRFLLHQRSR